MNKATLFYYDEDGEAHLGLAGLEEVERLYPHGHQQADFAAYATLMGRCPEVLLLLSLSWLREGFGQGHPSAIDAAPF